MAGGQHSWRAAIITNMYEYSNKQEYEKIMHKMLQNF